MQYTTGYTKDVREKQALEESFEKLTQLLIMKPIYLHGPDQPPATSFADIAGLICAATDKQVAEKDLPDDESRDDFQLSSDALNYYRIEWRLREEWGELDEALNEKIKSRVCKIRGYDREEFDAALMATKHRARLPYGWTAWDVAIRRLETHPVKLLNSELESSRYAKGIITLAIHLQEIQKDEPILLPVDQVREFLKAKKVVVAGTILKLVEMGLLEMTKANYNTGSAREFLFKGEVGKDYVFMEPGGTTGVVLPD